MKQIIKESAALASNGSGKETVGLILDNGIHLDLIPCRNKSKHGGKFSFYAQEVRSIVAAAKLLGYEIVGTYHSHPAGLAEPSQSDTANAVDDSLMLIIDCIGRRAALWKIRGGKAREVPFTIVDGSAQIQARQRIGGERPSHLTSRISSRSDGR